MFPLLQCCKGIRCATAGRQASSFWCIAFAASFPMGLVGWLWVAYMRAFSEIVSYWPKKKGK